MIPQNNTNEKALPEINIQFINAIRELKISSLLKRSDICKSSRSRSGDGGEKRTAFEIFQFLLMLVFEGKNLFRFLGSKKQDIACSKSTYYRFLSNCHYNWRRFLLLAGRAVASAKAEKRIVPVNTTIDRRTNGAKVREDAVMQKPAAAITLIHSALEAGIEASCVLMDAWFTNEPFIHAVLGEGLDVIGMLKDNKQKYFYKGKLLGLKELSRYIQADPLHNTFGSVAVYTKKYRIPVKLVFVRNRNKPNEYIVLLSTDCSLADCEIVRRYGNRWPIECCFKACKSLLKLGSEFHRVSYDLTVSSTALVFTLFILLEWMRRKHNDEKTIAELFFVCCEDIQDMELSTALRSLMSIFAAGIRSGSIIIDENVRVQLIGWFVSQPTFIQAIFPEFIWDIGADVGKASILPDACCQ